jgi:hypothetical protein
MITHRRSGKPEACAERMPRLSQNAGFLSQEKVAKVALVLDNATP